jgi:hypothetical protein
MLSIRLPVSRCAMIWVERLLKPARERCTYRGVQIPSQRTEQVVVCTATFCEWKKVILPSHTHKHISTSDAVIVQSDTCYCKTSNVTNWLGENILVHLPQRYSWSSTTMHYPKNVSRIPQRLVNATFAIFALNFSYCRSFKCGARHKNYYASS